MCTFRVAIIYDDSARPDTTGYYCARAMSCLTKTVHVRPEDIGSIDCSDFDLFLNIDDGLRYRLPSSLRPAAWWAIDTHLDFDWYLEKAPDFDFVFTAQRDAVAKLVDGGHNACWLPLACDPAFHRIHQVSKKWNISFVGNMFPGPRTELLELLQRHFTDVLVERRFFDEMAQAFSESRIVFNRSIRNDVNMRVFEGTASGSFVLTNELSDNGLGTLFEYGKHLEVYGSAEELLDKTAFYLAHEDARERIGRLGHTHAYRYHTYRRRMQDLLTAVTRGRTTNTTWISGTKLTFRPSEPAHDVTSIIIPTFNQLEFTRQCLDSVRANTAEPYELIVVDNGSTDGTVEYLEDCPDVILVCNRENRGFPAATNQGLRLSRGRYIVLLNNDTIVPNGWLRRLQNPLQDETIGLVGPYSNCVSGPQQVESTYATLHELDQFAYRREVQNRGLVEDSERLVGFCLLIGRNVIDRIGLLDERFGLGCFEDDDYTLRARQAGFRTVIACDAFVHHFGSQTFLRSGIDYGALMERNRDRFIQKWSSTQFATMPAGKVNAPQVVVDRRGMQLRVLLLAHLRLLRERVDRSQYLRYLALEKNGVSLFGPGADGYRPGMSVGDAIESTCGGQRPDWIVHGLDPRASGVPIVQGLSQCGIPTAYEFGDSWAWREEQSQFVNSQRFELAFAFATRDIPFYRSKCPATEIILLPNAVDTNIFRDYGESKEWDVLVYGALNPDYYPFRCRIRRALASQDQLRVRIVDHPDYYPEGGWENEAVVAGEKLARVINRSWIAIATQGALGVFFMKYLEIAASGAVIAGDMPVDGLPFLGSDYIDLSQCKDDASLIAKLGAALEDKESLRSMTERARKTVCDELSTDRFAIRLLQTLSDWITSSGQRATVQVPAKTQTDCIESLRRKFTWPDCRPESGPDPPIEGWLADGAREALRATLDDRVELVIELGSWLGLSTRFIADCAPRAKVIAIDHFRGSSEHVADRELASLLPRLYNSFLSRNWNYRDKIIPIRASTVEGMQELAHAGARPDVIYVDADHKFESVTTDLRTAWSLFPEAVLVGDDFSDDSVRRAVAEFAQERDVSVEVFGRDWLAWRMIPRRPPSTADDTSSASTVSTPPRPWVISLCMIVRDNEGTLDACLSSIRPWVDEVIVVDTGSTDRTPEIARNHGAKVFEFPWPDSFALARNESLRHATGEWIFWMDSDDTITPESGEKLRGLLAQPVPANVLGYIMQVHCPSLSPDGDSDATVVDHIKMFRNRDDLRFEGRIHEQIMPSIRRAGGEVVWTDIFVVHSGADQSPDARKRKQDRDLRLLRLEEAERPDNSFVLFNIGMTFADRDDHADAVCALERSIAVAEPSESHLRKAYALLIASLTQLGRFEDAERNCTKGLELFPSDLELLFREGFIAHHFQLFERAVNGYRRALAAPEVQHFSSVDRGLRGYKTRQNLALAYEDLQQYALAEEQWRLVVAEVPTYWLGWRSLIRSLIKQEKLNQASQLVDRTLRQGSPPAEAHLSRSEIARARGDIVTARRELEHGLAAELANIELLDHYCRLLFEYGEPHDAEIRLRELIALDSENASAWHNLGSIYLRLTQHSAAEEAFRTAIRLRPDSAASYLHLGFALEQLGDHTAARSAWQKVIEVAPQDPTAHQAADCLHRSSQPRQSHLNSRRN